MVEAETSSSYGEARLHFGTPAASGRRRRRRCHSETQNFFVLPSHLNPLPLNLRIKSSPFILYSHPPLSLPWLHLAPFLPLPTRRRKRPVLCTSLRCFPSLRTPSYRRHPQLNQEQHRSFSSTRLSSLPYTIEDTRRSFAGLRHPRSYLRIIACSLCTTIELGRLCSSLICHRRSSITTGQYNSHSSLFDAPRAKMWSSGLHVPSREWPPLSPDKCSIERDLLLTSRTVPILSCSPYDHH